MSTRSTISGGKVLGGRGKKMLAGRGKKMLAGRGKKMLAGRGKMLAGRGKKMLAGRGKMLAGRGTPKKSRSSPRKHRGINQRTGNLKKGFRYAPKGHKGGSRTASGLPKIISAKK